MWTPPAGTRAFWPEALLLLGFAGLTVALANGFLLDADVAVRDWVDSHRPEPLRLAARALNFLGSANLLAPIMLGLALLTAYRRRTWWLVVTVLVTFSVSYVVVVPIKILADRAAPHSIRPRAVELFANDAGWSFPSGHVVNTLIWYPLLIALLASLGWTIGMAARRAILVAPVVIVSATVTYLAFHWLSDTIAGLLLGGALVRLLRRVPPSGGAGRDGDASRDGDADRNGVRPLGHAAILHDG